MPVDGDAEIMPGLQVLALPSHTVGFQGVLVNTAAGPIVVLTREIVVVERAFHAAAAVS